MHEHDLDLIAEFAQGSPEPGVERARRLVETCDVCAAEYRAQREIRTLLAGLPSASMSDAERVVLREAVLGGLPSEPSPRRAPSRAVPRRWYALGSAAAALLLVVGLVGVLSNMGGSDTADLAVPAADEAASTTTAAEAGSDVEALERYADDGGAAADTTMEMAAAEAVEEPPFPPVVDLGPADRAALDEAIERMLASVEATDSAPLETGDLASDLSPSCLDSAGGRVHGVVMADLDGSRIEVFVIRSADGATSLESFEAETCEPFPLD